MMAGWGYEVSIVDAVSRPTAVVAATTTWQDFPAYGDAAWRGLGLPARGRDRPWMPQHHAVLDGVPNVEVGVLSKPPCPLVGRVVAVPVARGGRGD